MVKDPEPKTNQSARKFQYYKNTLPKAIRRLDLTPKTSEINRFLQSLSCSLGGKYGYQVY